MTETGRFQPTSDRIHTKRTAHNTENTRTFLELLGGVGERPAELLLGVVEDLALGRLAQTFQKLLLNRAVQLRRRQGLALLALLALLDLRVRCDNLGTRKEIKGGLVVVSGKSLHAEEKVHLRRLKFQLSHSNKHLVDFGQSLLVSVHQILGEVLQLSGDQFQSLHVVGRQLNFLPHVLGCVGALNSLNKQIAVSFFLSDGGISTVGKRACTSDAQTSYVISMLTESSFFGNLGLERTELMVDNLPDNVVVLHG